MYKTKRILALIPARGGSKGLPKKNIKEIVGKPLIAWTIESAKQSMYIDKVVISSDNDEIINVSKKFGADVPFKRPDKISNDQAGSMQVIKHTIDFFESNNDFYDLLIYLQPTSPLRQTTDIDNAIEYFFIKNAVSVVSVTEADHPPYWSNILPEDKSMSAFLPKEIRFKNRQELPKYYKLNGAIFISTINNLKENADWYVYNSFSYIMPKDRSIDIDDEIDFKLAEIFMERRCNFV